MSQDIARVHGTHHKGSRRQLEPPTTTNISHTYANCPLSPLLAKLHKYSQTGNCETRRANHCCASVSNYCQGPWNTPQRQQKAATTANNNKHQPYLRQLPPFFHSWRV